MSKDLETAYFGAGCFWNSELVYSKQKGVAKTEVGFGTYDIEGEINKPKVEVVKVEYDPNQISYDTLVDIFWSTHNPAAKNNSDPFYDEKSVLFSVNSNQESIAKDKLNSRKMTSEGKDDLTDVIPLSSYHKAPEKDQKYYQKK